MGRTCSRLQTILLRHCARKRHKLSRFNLQSGSPDRDEMAFVRRCSTHTGLRSNGLATASPSRSPRELIPVPSRSCVERRGTSPEVLDALHRRGIAAAVSGTDGLLSQPEVVDAISVLQVISDPAENSAMLRILLGPRMRIGPRDLAVLGERASALAREAARSSKAKSGRHPMNRVVAPSRRVELISPRRFVARTRPILSAWRGDR